MTAAKLSSINVADEKLFGCGTETTKVTSNVQSIRTTIGADGDVEVGPWKETQDKLRAMTKATISTVP